MWVFKINRFINFWYFISNQYGFYIFWVSSLESIDLLGFDGSSLTSLYNIFNGLISLKYIDLLNFNASSAESMTIIFYGCTSLESIISTNFNAPLVLS